eukprot:TRINITY_DN6567_c0_g1_i1.p1 TRINITY_DN6567_c0_g1~~TRINITY_DN6567_c0_g1_i1.p1  ORF type:complete len:612 (-),score=94.13 TRINITY_DN6567_c0_g1_i1:54-1889(-)
MAAMSGGLEIWPYHVTATGEPANLSISETQEQSLPCWRALASLVNSAAQEWSLYGQVPGCQSEARTHRNLGFSIAVDTHNFSLVVQRKQQERNSCSSMNKTFSVPLIGADIHVAKVEARQEFDSEVPQCILGLAPKKSLSSLGDGGDWKNLDNFSENSDEAWLFCVGCQVDVPRLLDKLGRCGAIRFDFAEAFKLGNRLPQNLWVGGTNHHFAQARAGSRQPRRIAVRIAQDGMRSFLREVALLVRFQSHPNMLQFHSAFAEAEQEPKLTFELHADTLHSAIQVFGPFSQERSCEIMVGLTSALACLHRQRLVHRNVQNSTVLLDSKGQAVLSGLDGVACVDDFDAMNSFWGAPGFAAPEVVSLKAYGVRADIFSAGVVFYHMLSGVYPFGYFTGENLKQITKYTLKCKPNFEIEGLESLPASLLFNIRSMLSKNPKARPLLAYTHECCRGLLPDELRKKHETEDDAEEITVLPVLASGSVLEVQAKLPKLPQLAEMPSSMERLTEHARDRESPDGTLSARETHGSSREASAPKPPGSSILRYIGGAMRGAKSSLPVAWRMVPRRSPQVAPKEDCFKSLLPAESMTPIHNDRSNSMFKKCSIFRSRSIQPE